MTYKKTSGLAEGLLDAKLSAGRDFLDYDPVGLPDEKDIINIRNIIREHEIAHPGEIAKFVQQASTDRAADKATGSGGYTTADKSIRRVLTMPIGLMREIEEAYPLMFTNRKHLTWFRQKFWAFNPAAQR